MANWPTIIDDDGGGTTGTVLNKALFDLLKLFIQVGSHQSGLDDDKPTPSLGDVYVATDTLKVYFCFSAEDWTDVTQALSIAFTPAGDIEATDVQAAIEELDTEKVAKALFDANTILAANEDNIPLALGVAEQTLVGRIIDGNIAALTAAQVRTLINVENGAGTTGQISITIEDPSALEDICIGFTFGAITVTEIQAVVKGSSTPSVTIDPYHTLDRSGAGTNNDILASAIAITNTTTGQNLTSFDDPTIPQDSWIILKTTARSGTVDELTITIKYNID